MFASIADHAMCRLATLQWAQVRDSCNVVCLAEKDSVTPFVASVNLSRTLPTKKPIPGSQFVVVILSQRSQV